MACVAGDLLRIRGVRGLARATLLLHRCSLLRHGLRLLQHRVDATNHVERHLRDLVVRPHQKSGERLHRVVQLHVVARHAREHLRNLERLRQEPGHLARAVHHNLVLLAQLVDTKHRDDILQLLVLGQHLHDILRNVVVVHVDHIGVHDTRRALQRVHGRVDARLRHSAVQHSRRVQVRERRRGRGIRDIIRRHVHRLHGRDRPLRRRRDTLLQHAKILRKRGLVAHGSRNAAQQRRHLGVRLCEAEDVVDEQQHVLALHVAEVLGHRQSGLRDARARTRGLVHLPVHKHALRITLQINHLRLHHLQVQVRALARALANTSKHRETTVALRHVVDQLHDDHSLPHTSTAEQADLATLAVGQNQVNHLDTSRQNRVLRGLIRQLRGLSVDRHAHLLANGAALVDRVAQHVEDAAQRLAAHRHRDVAASRHNLRLQLQQVRRLHRNAAARVRVQVLHDLQRQRLIAAKVLRHVQRRKHRRHALREVYVHHGTNDLRHVANAALVLCRLRGSSGSSSRRRRRRSAHPNSAADHRRLHTRQHGSDKVRRSGVSCVV
ncbi:ATPase beta subunit, putative [Leishmania tarentolae]|uniref:ATPase beta subunit, putative n=1 Tax=Leishmania tarentolae TaxID=5689 RepID=A0A640KI29_LEITA|nr:ATPase beta subunit, putative [Leishmania tarentolae]